MKTLNLFILYLFLFCFTLNNHLEAGCGKKRKRRQADYILVGVGTAGAAMVEELTKDKKTSNALTEYLKESVASYQCFQSHCRMAPQNQGEVVDSTGHV